MDHKKLQAFFDSYCYGPVDLNRIFMEDNALCLSMKDHSGKPSKATYHHCIYWQLDQEQLGIHFSLVQRVDAQELLKYNDIISLLKIQKNTNDISKLLLDWENEGFSFYIHLSNRTEFLIVAQSLEYSDKY